MTIDYDKVIADMSDAKREDHVHYGATFRLSLDFTCADDLLDFVESFSADTVNATLCAFQVDDLDRRAKYHYLLKREDYKPYGKLVR